MIMQCRKELNGSRDALKQKTEKINLVKQEIDRSKTMLDRKEEKKREKAYHASLAPGFSDTAEGFDETDHKTEIIDEEELQMIRQLKDLKKEYRENFNAIKDLKSAINFAQNAIDSAKQKMVVDFEQWYLNTFEDPLPLAVSKSTASVSPLKAKQSVSERLLILLAHAFGDQSYSRPRHGRRPSER